MRNIYIGIILLSASAVGVILNKNKKWTHCLTGLQDEKIKSIIKIIYRLIIDMSAVLSVILVFFTLREMQIERDNAYRPTLVFETMELELDLGKENSSKCLDFDENDDKHHSMELSFLNIGVGVAKNISINVDKEWYGLMGIYLYYLQDKAGDEVYKYSLNDVNYVCDNPDGTSSMCEYESFEKLYILPNAEEITKFEINKDLLDMLRSIKIQEYNALSSASNGWQVGSIVEMKEIILPQIKLNVNFQDVQGKQYNKELYLNFETGMFKKNSDGHVTTKLKVSMETEGRTWDWKDDSHLEMKK